MSRLENTKRNIIWAIIERFIFIVFPFLIKSIFIKKIGIEILGLNELFVSILQVLNMAELGFSNAIIYNLYLPISKNDVQTISMYMNVYRKVYRIIGSIILILGIILLPFLKYLIHFDVQIKYNIYVLYLIQLFNTVLTYFLFAYKTALLTAYQRNDILSKTRTVTFIISYILQFCVLIFLENYYIYLIVLPLMTIFNNILNSFIVDKIYKLYPKKLKLSFEQRNNLKYNVAGLMIGKVCVASRNSLDSIFLSVFINLRTVGIYSNYYHIISSLNNFGSIVSNSMMASVGDSVSVEKIEKNYNNFKLFNFIYQLISGYMFICLVCLYQPFMEIWVGNDLMFPFNTVVILCIYFYSLKLGDIRSVYTATSGLFWESRFYVICESICNIILNYFLAKKFGVNGVVFATIVTIVMINFLWGTKVLFDCYFKNGKYYQYIIEQIGYFLVAILLAYISLKISSIYTFGNLIDLLFRGIVCTIVTIIGYCIVYSKHSLKKDAFKLLEKILFK